MNAETVAQWTAALERGEFHAVCAATGKAFTADDLPTSPVINTQTRRLIFPGAFNPLHNGHRAMADFAEDRLGLPIEFEISIVNVDKPALSAVEIEHRLTQFPPDQPVWLTRAMQFREKAELFPAATFVVGADTIGRIADDSYYDDEHDRAAAIQHIIAHQARFLVFGRRWNGEFQSLDCLTLPAALRDLCTGVPKGDFDHDVSSTEIRIAGRNDPS